jgi:predicted DsbA family dithiol-disulfide isomerase
MLLALAATAALAIEYRSIDSAFCGAESGCAALRRTPLAYLWGIGMTLPEVGLLGLTSIYALTLTKQRRLAAGLAVAAGLAGLGFIVAQAFVLHAFCWLCLTVDFASLGAAGAGLALLLGRANLDAKTPLASWTWPALSALAILSPALWPSVRPTPPVPEVIRSYYKPGKINVVEFADFQCPFCRNLHQRLKALLKARGERVNFVRLNMPLDSHVHARDAALAVLCAEDSGKSEAMADFLFSTEDLAFPAIRQAAQELGLDPVAFERCLAAPATAARLAHEIEIVHKAGLEGLPTTYVGGRRIVGAQSDDTFEAAIERAASGEDERGVPGWAYVAVVIALLAAILRFGYQSGAERESSSPSPVV